MAHIVTQVADLHLEKMILSTSCYTQAVHPSAQLQIFSQFNFSFLCLAVYK